MAKAWHEHGSVSVLRLDFVYSRDAFAAALALWKKHEMLEKVQAAALARE